MEYDEFTHNNRYVYVDWDMSSRCNFSCYYCSPESHDNKINFPKISDAISLVDKIATEFQGVKDFAVYNLLGGEPTIWTQLPEFSEYVKKVNKNNIIQLLTNGNKTVRWWRRNAPYIDKIILTVHVAQTDIVELVEKFNQLVGDIHIDFQFAMDIAIFDKCITDYHYAYENLHKNISINPKPLRTVLSANELMPYTDVQLDILKNLPRRWGSELELDSAMIKKYHGDITDTDVNISKLVMNKKNSWKGWACWVGIDTITINRDGNIKIGSSCNPDLVLGNISKLDFKIPLIPVKCRYDVCSCFTDIMATKIKDYSLPMIFGEL
tara:strand:+ start:355 stop:1323 length:969 start_codon:yes stop_codon:yes gene_type:complete